VKSRHSGEVTSIARSVAAVALGAASVLVLAACAATPGSGSGGPQFGAVLPAPPSGEVLGQGTVVDEAGQVELCLGGIAESYPPQCGGIPMSGWTWDDVEGGESSGEVRWGAYAVQGTFDGEVFSVTQAPIMLALYDPTPFPDPTAGRWGAGTEAQLREIQDQLPDRLGEAYLSSSPENGYLWVDVVWDDGTWQDAADEEFGDDVVVIRPALRAIGD
jgi:hypothetical protein